MSNYHVIEENNFRWLLIKIKKNKPRRKKLILASNQLSEFTEEEKEAFFAAVKANPYLTYLDIRENVLDKTLLNALTSLVEEKLSLTTIELDLDSDPAMQTIQSLLKRNCKIELDKPVKLSEVFDEKMADRALFRSAFDAVYEDDVRLLAFLIAQNKKVLERTDNYGCTLLHIAAQHGRVDCAKFLLQQGIDCNRFNDNGNNSPYAMGTALNLAVANNHAVIVEFLLQHKAIIHHEKDPSQNPLYAARSLQVLHLLLSHGAKIDRHNALHWALSKPHPCALVIHFLLRQGAEINAVNRRGQTPLFTLVENFKWTSKELFALLVCLLEAGANVDHQDDDREEVLDLIMQSGGKNRELMIGVIEAKAIQLQFNKITQGAKNPHHFFNHLPSELCERIACYAAGESELKRSNRVKNWRAYTQEAARQELCAQAWNLKHTSENHEIAVQKSAWSLFTEIKYFVEEKLPYFLQMGW